VREEVRFKIIFSVLIFTLLVNLIFLLFKIYDAFKIFIEKDAVFIPLNYLILLKNEFIKKIFTPIIAGIIAGVILLLFLKFSRYKKYKRKEGFGLIETFISLTILALVTVGMLAYLQYGMLLNIKAKEINYAVRVTDVFISKLDSIPYPYVFSCDSNEENFGLNGTFGPVTNQTSTYPYLGILEEFKNLIKNYGFTRFKITTYFLLRDLSDLDGDGLITDLRNFTDENSDLIDDYDPEIKYEDYNKDADYYDIFGEPEQTEEPNTHLKKVVIKIYRKAQLVYTTSKIISWEKYTGVESKASGAELKLVITQPPENGILYALTTEEQINSHNLSITKEYPEDVVAYRADPSSPLQLIGTTDPLANIEWRLGGTDTPTLDTVIADNSGDFNFFAFNLTANLNEGENLIYGIALKDEYSSPWSKRRVILDINPPAIEQETPTGVVKTLQPLIEAVIVDEPVGEGNETSGICPDVITIKYESGSGVGIATHTFDSSTGKVRWIDSEKFLPVFTQGEEVIVTIEAGDYALYKVSKTFSFKCLIDSIDNSPPVVSEKSPVGVASSNPPLISCKVFDNQSGIDIQSIILELDGNEVVNSSNITEYYSPISNPIGGYINYLPSTPLSQGEHSVTVKVSHWAENPSDKKERIETWSFNVP